MGREPEIASTSVSVDQLSYRYGDTQALAEVSFSVPTGSLFGLLGPNGSGKTTLFRLLATLLPLQQGKVSVCGFNLKSQPQDVRRQLGVTFQSPAVDARLTVLENLLCHGRIYGISSVDLRDRIDTLLEEFLLSDRRQTIVGELSGGLRRRVELAKGLIHQPRVLLLDEPSTGLDPAARQQFWDLINEQRQRERTTVIVTTHLMEEAGFCEELLLLDHGSVVAGGTPHQLQATVSGQRLAVRTQNNPKYREDLESLLQATARPLGDRLCFRLNDATDALRVVMDKMADVVLSAEVAQPTLEDVFLEKTGRGLSDSGGVE